MRVNKSEDKALIRLLRKELGEQIPGYWVLANRLSTQDNDTSFFFCWWRAGDQSRTLEREKALQRMLDNSPPGALTWSARVCFKCGQLGYSWEATYQALAAFSLPASGSGHADACQHKTDPRLRVRRHLPEPPSMGQAQAE